MNADAVEIGWLLISLAGTFYTFHVLRDALHDREVVEREGLNSVAELHTTADVWHERRRFAAQLLLDAIGVIAIFSPPAPTARTTAGWFAVGILIVFNLLFAYNSYSTLETRKQSLEILRKQARGEDHKESAPTRRRKFKIFEKQRRKAYDASEVVEREAFEVKENER